MIYLSSIFCLFVSLINALESAPGETSKALLQEYAGKPTISEIIKQQPNYLVRASLLESRLPEATDTVRVFIHPSTELTRHSRTGATADFFVTTVSYRGKIKRLEDQAFVSASLPSQIELYLDTIVNAVPITLKPKAQERLLHYLTLGPPKRPFDCGSFASYLSGIKVRDRKDKPYLESLTRISSISPDELIAISKSTSPNPKDIVHYAYSLGSGLYLSKFGTRGKVRVTNLEQMKEFYDGVSAYRIIARS